MSGSIGVRAEDAAVARPGPPGLPPAGGSAAFLPAGPVARSSTSATVVSVINGSVVRDRALDLVEGTFHITRRELPGGDTVANGAVDRDEGEPDPTH